MNSARRKIRQKRPEGLVDQAIALKGVIARQVENLKVIEGKLIAKGAGKHSGSDGKSVTVVGAQDPKPGEIVYDWPEAKSDEDAADLEVRIKRLSGEHFGKLFLREVIHSPVEGFVAIANAVLTPAKARDVVGLCAKQGRGTSGKSAYLIYPK